MATIKTFGEQELLNQKDLNDLSKITKTCKYVIPLEIDIYGDILIHYFWPMNMITSVNPMYVKKSFDLHNVKFHDDEPIDIKCGNCLQEAALIFNLEMFNESQKLFNEILMNIAQFTKTSHYPAIGIVEVPAGSKYMDVTNVPGCVMILDSDIKLTNIICGFGNDEAFFKNFLFTGYDQENVEKLPQVFKFQLNHNMY